MKHLHLLFVSFFLVLTSTGTLPAESIRLDLGVPLGTGASDGLSSTGKIAVGPIADLPMGPAPQGRMAAMPRLTPAQVDAMHTQALRNFVIYLAALCAVFVIMAYVLGRQVITRGWKVGYTRKTQAVALYFLPYIAMNGPSPYAPIMTASISIAVFMALLVVMSAPFRRRIPALATCFASIDRPEDRPFTLTWLITSNLATWAVLIAWMWAVPQTMHLIFIALFISGIGDALAEPVGLLIGKHSYRTRALWTDRTYVRTLEGSAVVFLSGVLAVFLVYGFQFNTYVLLCLATFPIVGAVAEAKSPHTWDQPFIVASTAAVAIGLHFLYPLTHHTTLGVPL